MLRFAVFTAVSTVISLITQSGEDMPPVVGYSGGALVVRSFTKKAGEATTSDSRKRKLSPELEGTIRRSWSRSTPASVMRSLTELVVLKQVGVSGSRESVSVTRFYLAVVISGCFWFKTALWGIKQQKHTSQKRCC